MLFSLVEQSERNTDDSSDKARYASDVLKTHVGSQNYFVRRKVFTTRSSKEQRLEEGNLLLLLTPLFYISSSGFLL